MWQLELLSHVIPAFGALAKDFVNRDNPHAELSEDAQDCYSDIVGIGLALFVSCGEWASGLREEEVTELLKALESRLPKASKGWLPTKWALRDSATEEIASPIGRGEREKFPKLNDLSVSIKSRGLGGYDECFELPGQTTELHERYLAILPNIRLFHRKEKEFERERGKFLQRIKEGCKHLLDVYCGNRSGLDDGAFNLSQHPSHGMKELAGRVYNLLEQHWKCHCSHQAARLAEAREARLCLTRHRQLVLKLPSQETTAQGRLPAKFEVLLPVCKGSVEWKVTNIEVVKKTWTQAMARTERQSVNNDICQWLLRSEGFEVNFLAEDDRLWHLKPELVDGTNHYTTMESLHQLLGDGIAVSHISKYGLREKLILCYLLANSMLFLYPGSWFQTAWSSNQLFFIRRVNSSTSSDLTFPYLSVELQQDDQAPKKSPHHMQYHLHPAILSLGIIFLEIATGARFTRKTCQPTEWEQCNSDGRQALEHLLNLEKQSERDFSKRISRTLKEVIRSCLMLKPPPNFPSKTLSEEGPIRHYILSCIVQPLASELRVGYKIPLEKLLDDLILEQDADNLNESTVQKLERTSQRPSHKAGDSGPATMNEDAESTFAERRVLCLLADGGDKEAPVKEKEISIAKRWFEWHDDALGRINNKLRKSDICNAKRVKIAILDSGIDLSRDHEDMYNFEPKIEYHSWIDEGTVREDDVGHGTHLAVLLRRIAPNAVIHVARVFKKKPKAANSAEIIAQAIRHAVDTWDVDIIVMSFGFANGNKTLYDAIKYAAFKDVLMFAAASNDGKNRPDGVAWPASETSVICVHSGDGFGNPSPFTPSPKDNMKIMVLGECVRSAWPQKLKSPSDHKHMSGTSCAAPIAAGIAAVVLDYARGFLSQQEWESLRQVDSMRRMFEALKDRDSNTGYWWIKYWKLFDSNRDESWIQGEIRRSIS